MGRYLAERFNGKAVKMVNIDSCDGFRKRHDEFENLLCEGGIHLVGRCTTACSLEIRRQEYLLAPFPVIFMN